MAKLGWIMFSVEAETIIEAALARFVSEEEGNLAELGRSLVIQERDSELYVDTARWLATARLTLEAVRNAAALGALANPEK